MMASTNITSDYVQRKIPRQMPIVLVTTTVNNLVTIEVPVQIQNSTKPCLNRTRQLHELVHFKENTLRIKMEKFQIVDQKGGLITVECPAGTSSKVGSERNVIEEIVKYATADIVEEEEELEQHDNKEHVGMGQTEEEMDLNDIDAMQLGEKHVWTHGPTLLLLRLVQQNIDKLGTTQAMKTKKQMWQFISETLKAKGYQFNAQSVENKWKGLSRHYKKVLEAREKYGRLRRTRFIYEKQMDEIRKIKENLLKHYSMVASIDETTNAHHMSECFVTDATENETCEAEGDDENDASVLPNFIKAVWTQAQTRTLVTLMLDYIDKIGKQDDIRTKKQMWQQIHKEMCLKGYKFSVDSIENKWKSLYRQYRRTMQNRVTGRGSQFFIYENEFNEYLHKTHKCIDENFLTNFDDETCKTTFEETITTDPLSNFTTANTTAVSENITTTVTNNGDHEITTFTYNPPTNNDNKFFENNKFNEETPHKSREENTLAMRRLKAYERRTIAIERRNQLMASILDKFGK